MVEVPSHLFEHWAIDAEALGFLARHRSGTRDRLPAAAIEALVGARRSFSALELQGQARMKWPAGLIELRLFHAGYVVEHNHSKMSLHSLIHLAILFCTSCFAGHPFSGRSTLLWAKGF